ncbi:MAG: hypothetical protein IJY25_02085 [Bacilli bacterium]|nr:hypothetical protein [Bacilli bacterium]
MKILGLNGWETRGHDGGASLIIDGKLVSAVEEEKLIGFRHAYDTLPIESINFVLGENNLTLDDVDKIAIGWDYPYLYSLINQEFLSKEEVSKIIFNTEKYADKIEYVKHHDAHAASAFYPSRYKDAIVLVIDGQGEIMGTSIYIANDYKIKHKVMETPVSLGYFYSAITEHIGFDCGEEGKTMGLASYGEPIYADALKKLINVDSDGNLNCVFKIKKTGKDEEDATIDKWHEFLDLIIDRREGKIKKVTDDIKPYADLAASAQSVIGDIIVELVRNTYQKYKIQDVVIAGGVGLNCPTNTMVENQPYIQNVFIQPAANDGGISLGAALYVASKNEKNLDIDMTAYLGPEYTENEILESIYKTGAKYIKMNYRGEEIANLLNNNYIVANYFGKLEFGPRALGNRSLLANPKEYDMLVRMNQLKGREVWRPLAPIVLYSKQKDWFNYDKESLYMIKNCLVNLFNKENIQAVTHVDNTARIQSVTRQSNSQLYDILNEFYKLSKIPVLINTSFNIKGCPIVNNPADALYSAKKMNIDYLALGDYLVDVKTIDYKDIIEDLSENRKVKLKVR